MKKEITEKINVPEDVNVEINGNSIIASSGSNKLEKNFYFPNVGITKNGNQVILNAKNGTKVEKRMIGSFGAIIKNMVNGVKSNYIYKIMACSSHFPMNITVDKKEIVIKNFLGEKVPRKANIIDGVNVSIEGNIINVKGIDKEMVGMMAGKIELLTKIKGRDRRIFQDGCYIIDKAGKLIK